MIMVLEGDVFMQAKGNTYLYIAGIFEILLGVLTLGLIFYAMTMNNSASIKVFGTYPKDMPSLQLLGIYIQIGLQIIAGLLGILFANKREKYKICQLLALFLLGILIYNYILMEVNAQAMISAFVSVIPPLLYYMGASRNKDTLLK